MARDRICLACLKSYKYCNTCNEDATKPRWMVKFDTEACKELFNIISAYNMDLVDKDKVKEILDKYNITDFSQYKESIKNKLEELFPINKTVVDTETAIEEPKKYEGNSFRRRNHKKKNDEENEANTEE